MRVQKGGVFGVYLRTAETARSCSKSMVIRILYMVKNEPPQKTRWMGLTDVVASVSENLKHKTDWQVSSSNKLFKPMNGQKKPVSTDVEIKLT